MDTLIKKVIFLMWREKNQSSLHPSIISPPPAIPPSLSPPPDNTEQTVIWPCAEEITASRRREQPGWAQRGDVDRRERLMQKPGIYCTFDQTRTAEALRLLSPLQWALTFSRV